MITVKLFLLIGLVYTAYAAHIGHHEVAESYGDDSEHEEEFDWDETPDSDFDESADFDLIPARNDYGSRRTVMWNGPSSYSGYNRYSRDNRTPPPRPVHPPQVAPRQTYTSSQSYQSRQYYQNRPSYTSRQQPTRVVNVPLHNRNRGDDPNYRQGLQELADLM